MFFFTRKWLQSYKYKFVSTRFVNYSNHISLERNLLLLKLICIKQGHQLYKIILNLSTYQVSIKFCWYLGIIITCEHLDFKSHGAFYSKVLQDTSDGNIMPPFSRLTNLSLKCLQWVEVRILVWDLLESSNHRTYNSPSILILL